MDIHDGIVSHSFTGHGEPKQQAPIRDRTFNFGGHGGGGGGGHHGGGGWRGGYGYGYGYPYPYYYGYPYTETVVVADAPPVATAEVPKEQAKQEVASTAKATTNGKPVNWSNVALWAITIGALGYIAIGGLKKNQA